MQQAILVELEAEHQCWCIELTEKFRGASLVGVPTHAERANSIAHVFIINSVDAPKAIEFIQQHPMTTIIKVVKKSGESAIVYVEQPKNSMFVNALVSRGAILAKPTLTRDGKDTVHVYFRDEKGIRSVFSELPEAFGVKLKSKQLIPLNQTSIETLQTSTLFQLQGIVSQLSPRQREVFSLACKRGYFKTPKKVTLEELAKGLGLDERTAADHLRKAKNKLLPALSEALKLF